MNRLGRWAVGFFAMVLAAILIAVVGAKVANVADAVPGYGTEPVHVHQNARPIPRITDLRVGKHCEDNPGFDRVVIDIHGKSPGYDVRFVKRLREDGTGDPVPLKGKKFVQITLNLAWAHKKDGSPTYHGPELQQYNFKSLRGVAFIGDFEGYVTFGVALRWKAPFKVLDFKDKNGPDRLVVDFRHRLYNRRQ